MRIRALRCCAVLVVLAAASVLSVASGGNPDEDGLCKIEWCSGGGKSYEMKRGACEDFCADPGSDNICGCSFEPR